MSSAALKPGLATQRFSAFQYACVHGARDTLVDIRQPTFAMSLIGAVRLFVDGLQVLVEPAQVVVARPGVRVRTEHLGCGSRGCAILVAVPEGSALGQFILKAQSTALRTLPVPASWMLRFRSLFDCRSEVSETEWKGVEGDLCARLRLSEPVTPTKAPSSLTLVEAVRRHLAEGFDQHLTLEELSDRVGLSKYHLARTFRAVTGHSVHRYQTYLRLEGALRHLRRGEEDLTDLALSLGFSSHSHFTSVFRRFLGTTPSAVRTLFAGRQIESR